MRRTFSTGLLSLAALSVLSTSVFAADLSEPIIEHTPKSSIGGAWYLRGDVGYTSWNNPDYQFNNITGSDTINYDLDADGAVMAGVGVGYTFNKWLRADLTFDVRENADIDGQAPCGLCGAGFTNESTSVSAYTLMLNGYVDLGEYAGFTPYVGAGIGAAMINYGRYVSDGNPAPLDPTQSYETSDDVRFAWSLMAGTAYHINPNLALDLGYRYLNVDGKQFADASSPGFDGNVEDDGFDAHEVRFGFRYTFGGHEADEGPIYFK